MLDLKNPDHEAALLLACEAKARDPRTGGVWPYTKSFPTNEDMARAMVQAEAFESLSSPASAAELIRQLVERAGSGVDVERVRGIQWRIAYYVGNEREWFAVNDAAGKVLETIPAIIARLLALPPNAGPGPALEALRGAP